MSDAIGLVGFYFTLIGFISSLFFTRIDGWYGSVRNYQGRISLLVERDDFLRERAEAQGLKTSAPTGSFIVVGVLIILLACLAFFIPINNPPLDPFLFIYVPITLTVTAYWVGGLVLLLKGHKLLSSMKQRIESGIHG